MRALISGRSKRYRVVPASLAVRATWAEREARAILAETEPGNSTPYEDARHQRIRPLPWGAFDSFGALAEALAAFVEG